MAAISAMTGKLAFPAADEICSAIPAPRSKAPKCWYEKAVAVQANTNCMPDTDSTNTAMRRMTCCERYSGHGGTGRGIVVVTIGRDLVRIEWEMACKMGTNKTV